MFLPQNTRQVPASGPPDAKIAVIGEAPSDEEIRRNAPFVGPAGRVLDNCLEFAQLIRSEIYITNLFKFKITKSGEKIIGPNKTVLHSSRKGFTEEGEECVRQLAEELNQHPANVLVPLGNPALNALTGKNGIHKWRGSILESTSCVSSTHKARKTIPTIHPAATLRGAPLDKYKIAADFRKIKRESEYPEIKLPEQVFRPLPDFNESIYWINHFIEKAKNGERINYDIEIMNGQVDCLSLSTNIHFAVSISLVWPHSWQEVQIANALSKLFELPNASFSNTNLLFDITTIGFKSGIIHRVTTQRLDDPMTAIHIIYPDFPKSQAFMTSVLTDIPYYKDDGKVYTGKGISKLGGSEQHRRYNCQDSATAIECMNQLDQELDETGYRKQYEDTMRLYPVLSTMMIRGVRVDTEKLTEAQKDVEEEVGNLQEKLDSMIGFHLNVRSHQQCQNYFYTYKGIRPFTNKGKVTTDEKAMARLAKGTASRKPMPEASLVIQIRRLKKLLSTYFSITLDHDNRFRCSYNPRGTTTGRLSSSETIFGTGMNMQNIPPAFRQFIVPDPGYILLEVDKRQAEWVVTAYLANDARMMEVHEKGLDAHARTAELITGVPLELVKKEHDLLKHETDPDEIQRKRSELIPEIEKVATFLPRAMTCRQAGKKSNHGLNYGMQAEKFALTNEIPSMDAEKIVKGYHLGYPGIANNYYTFVEQQLSRDRTLTNLFGHKRRFLQPYSNQLLNSAYDYMPQSTVGWVVNYGMIDTYHSPAETLKNAEILINSHDSLILQLPLTLQASGLSQAIEEVCKCLDPELTYHGRTFRLGTDFKLGYNWRDMKEASREENSPAKIQELLDALE